MSEPEVEWVDVDPEFGAAMPNGSCNARTEGGVCGFPRREDGSCINPQGNHVCEVAS